MAMRLLGLLFLLILLIVPAGLLAGGMGSIAKQRHLLLQSERTTATVLGTEVQTLTSIHSAVLASAVYRPIVRYRFDWRDRTFEGSGVLPLDRTGEREWATRLAMRYSVGDRVDCWVDPVDPANTFLVGQASFHPYLLVLLAVPMLMLAVFVAFRLRARWRRDHVRDGLLVPLGSVRWTHHRRLALVLIWVVGGGMSLAHWFVVLGRPFHGLSLLSLIAWSTVIPAIALPYAAAARRLRHVDDPKVAVSGVWRAGEAVRLSIEQPARHAVEVERWSLTLRCEESYRAGEAVHKVGLLHATRFVRDIELAVDGSTQAAELLEAEVLVQLPSTVPASSPSEQGTPRIDWELEYMLKLRGVGTLTCVYPLTVAAAESPDGSRPLQAMDERAAAEGGWRVPLLPGSR